MSSLKLKYILSGLLMLFFLGFHATALAQDSPMGDKKDINNFRKYAKKTEKMLKLLTKGKAVPFRVKIGYDSLRPNNTAQWTNANECTVIISTRYLAREIETEASLAASVSHEISHCLNHDPERYKEMEKQLIINGKTLPDLEKIIAPYELAADSRSMEFLLPSPYTLTDREKLLRIWLAKYPEMEDITNARVEIIKHNIALLKNQRRTSYHFFTPEEFQAYRELSERITFLDFFMGLAVEK